jgi:hypothetical protein
VRSRLGCVVRPERAPRAGKHRLYRRVAHEDVQLRGVRTPAPTGHRALAVRALDGLRLVPAAGRHFIPPFGRLPQRLGRTREDERNRVSRGGRDGMEGARVARGRLRPMLCKANDRRVMGP